MPPAPTPFQSLRLCRHADYQRVYQAARKQHGREMSFFFRLRSAEEMALAPGPRIGLTVGKVLGKAHDRNRIKRRMRAAVQRHAAVLAGLHVDVVLHPRRSVLQLEWPRLEAEVLHVFKTVRKLAAKQPAGTTAGVPGHAVRNVAGTGASAQE